MKIEDQVKQWLSEGLTPKEIITALSNVMSGSVFNAFFESKEKDITNQEYIEESPVSKTMKIVKVNEEEITFDNGFVMYSHHDSDCCESHYVDFSSIIGQGWEGKEFSTKLSEIVITHERLGGGHYRPKTKLYYENYDEYDGYTFVHLKDIMGNIYTLNIYNSNNGWYSNNVDIVLTEPDGTKTTKNIQ